MSYEKIGIPFPIKTKEYRRCWELVRKQGKTLDEAVAIVKSELQEKTTPVKRCGGKVAGVPPKHLSPHSPKNGSNHDGLDEDLLVGEDGISHDERVHASQLLASPVVSPAAKAKIEHALKGGTSEPPRIPAEHRCTPADITRIEGVLTRIANGLDTMNDHLSAMNKNLLNGRWGR